MKLVPPRFACLRPCATTARLGSWVAEAGAVGAVWRLSSKPGTSVKSLSLEPTKKAILLASSLGNSPTRPCGGAMFLLGFFMYWFSCSLPYDSHPPSDIPTLFQLTRGIGNKSEGSGYRLQDACS